MSNVLTYKGYSTRIEYSKEDNVLFGKIEGIADLVDFESANVEGVEDAFHEAVDDYLKFCAEVGKEPDKEYKGSFNVRVAPELHRALDLEAHKEGISMNQFIEKALSSYISADRRERNVQYQPAAPYMGQEYERIQSLWTRHPMNELKMSMGGTSFSKSRVKTYS